jgi:hypothetical protein
MSVGRRVKEDGPMLSEASGYNQAVDTIKIAVKGWRELYFGSPTP